MFQRPPEGDLAATIPNGRFALSSHRSMPLDKEERKGQRFSAALAERYSLESRIGSGGMTDSTPYHIMPFIEGETLEVRLARRSGSLHIDLDH